MKFAVFSDLHYDIIPDAERRIDEFIASAIRHNVDFMIDLGDFCEPKGENKKLLKKIKDSNIPCFFTIGNHNTDKCSIEEAAKFLGIDNSYYSFIWDDVKFIILDANYIKKPNGYLQYYKRNYDKSTDEYPYVPPHEIDWLKKELQDEHIYYIILSHQGLYNDFMKRGISNRKEIQDILINAGENGKNILICMNGHDHGTDYKQINGIHYYTLNSISYIWQGCQEKFSYTKEIHDKYRGLENMILYEEAFHVIVTIDENHDIMIDGMEGRYQKHSPQDIGMEIYYNGVSIEAKTISVFIPNLKDN